MSKVVGSINFEGKFKDEKEKQDIMNCLNAIVRSVSGHCFILDGTIDITKCEIQTIEEGK